MNRVPHTYCVSFVVLAMMIGQVQKPAWLDNYLARSDQQRQEALQLAEPKLKQLDLYLRMMRKGKINPAIQTGTHQKAGKIPSFEFSSKEVKQRSILSKEQLLDQQRAEVARLKKNDPPFYALLENPLPTPGDVGRLHYDGVKIEQVQGPSDVLVTVVYAEVFTTTRRVGDTSAQVLRDKRHERLVWISGLDTNGLVDGAKERMPYVFHVVGNKTYATVAGSSNTVAHLEVVPHDVLRPR